MKILTTLTAICLVALSGATCSRAIAADTAGTEPPKTSAQCTTDEQSGIVCKRKVDHIRRARTVIAPGTPPNAPADQICGWTCVTKCAEGACIETCESKRPACKGKTPWEATISPH